MKGSFLLGSHSCSCTWTTNLVLCQGLWIFATPLFPVMPW